MSDILEGLIASQRQAVTATDMHLLVVAGPGTGKTLTIVRRIAHYANRGIDPADIIAVTFTNRAAREMRERIEAYTGALRGMFIGTFHSLGLRLMRESLAEEFAVCTTEEQLEVLSSLVGHGNAKKALERLTAVKNGVEEPDKASERLYEEYEEALRRRAWRDYDDLILVPISLFEEGGVHDSFRRTPKHIIVDEYQDISPAQYRMLKSLAAAHPSSTLCAVGDADQAIYGFRGADVRSFLEFAVDFPNAASVVLTDNFRSTGTVVTAADTLIKGNLKRVAKDLNARKHAGVPIRSVSVADEREEAEFILTEIEHHVGGTSHFRLAERTFPQDFRETSHGFSDFCVLFRTNAQSAMLRLVLEEQGIPCQVIGARRHFDRKLLVEKMQARVREGCTGSELMSIIRESLLESGTAAAELDVIETIAAPHLRLGAPEVLKHVLDHLALLTSADSFDSRADAVTLMTLHMAKGLEFDVVFIAGCEDGLIPLAPPRGDTDIEEERRLFYVGITRAKSELFLIHARNRTRYGRRRESIPSRFLAELPAELVCTERKSDKVKRPRPPRQVPLF